MKLFRVALRLARVNPIASTTPSGLPTWGPRSAPGTDSIIVIDLYRDAFAAFQKLTITALALELAVLNHHAAARQNGVDGALDGLAFVSAVIDIHVRGVN